LNNSLINVLAIILIYAGKNCRICKIMLTGQAYKSQELKCAKMQDSPAKSGTVGKYDIIIITIAQTIGSMDGESFGPWPTCCEG
jgi:hypothetical protein